jgi:hypothetical protein
MESQREVVESTLRRGRAEDRFVTMCLRGLWEPAAVEEALVFAARGDLDWDALRRAVEAENLAPLLFPLLRGRLGVPPVVLKVLEQSYYHAAGSVGRMLHELEAVLEALARDAVPVLLLKGAALADTAYRGVGSRRMDDVDLLVPHQAGLRVAGHDFSGPVAGAVVDDDQLQLDASCLKGRPGGQHPLDDAGDAVCLVVGRDDDRQDFVQMHQK